MRDRKQSAPQIDWARGVDGKIGCDCCSLRRRRWGWGDCRGWLEKHRAALREYCSPGTASATQTPKWGSLSLSHLPPPSCPAPQVLETFPWDTTRVGVIIVEINEDVEKQEAIRSLLVGQHGFIQVDVLYGGVDDYYRHSSIKWDDSLRRKRKRRHPKGSHGC